MSAALIRLAPVGVLGFAVNSSNAALIALFFAALVYVVSVLKDIRPIKALRADNIELRTENAERDRKMQEKDAVNADLTLRLAAETARAGQLESSRDFSAAFAEAFAGYEKRAEDRAVRHEAHEREAWKEITGTLSLIAKALGASTVLVPEEGVHS